MGNKIPVVNPSSRIEGTHTEDFLTLAKIEVRPELHVHFDVNFAGVIHCVVVTTVIAFVSGNRAFQEVCLYNAVRARSCDVVRHRCSGEVDSGQAR